MGITRSKSLARQAIGVAHAIAEEVDVLELQGGLQGGSPAYVSKSFDIRFTSLNYVELIVNKLRAMGYLVYQKNDELRPKVLKIITYTGEKPK